MKPAQRGWVRSLPSGVVVNSATLGPIGRLLPAPGTWGSVAGALYFAWVFAPHLGLVGTLVLSALGFYLAVVLCGEAEVRLGKQDPGEVILDEFVAMPLCFLGWPRFLEVAPFWVIVLVGFGLFRLFDIWKPLGIAKLQALPGGWGVVVDDTAAALVSCAVMHLGVFGWLHFRG